MLQLLARSIRHKSSARLVKAAPPEKWIIEKTFTRVRSLADVPEQDDVYLLTQKMREYLRWYKKNPTEPFFHRKSGRVVLSLLHVEHNGKAEFVRGMNSEVSLPTGTICAERAAIVRARTAFPHMMRKQMKGIAVLEVPLVNWDKTGQEDLNNPLPPCGACNEWLLKIAEESPSFYVLMYKDLTLQEVRERFLFWSREVSATAGKHRGAWTCRLCEAQNVPLSIKCAGCKVNRFSEAYLNMHRSHVKLLQLLLDGPLSGAELTQRLEIRSTAARKMLRKLCRDGSEPILAQADGRYNVTKAGQEALKKTLKIADSPAVQSRAGKGQKKGRKKRDLV